ncbi:hypothetical protein B0H19DRAFT_1268171 [Mycena capillaripes]|nr:hypothetical protein B0H19DRAFT_1268171 [Mycena capillaripes]
MKINTIKSSYRYSPLAVRDVNRPSLSHPRQASEKTITQGTTAKLFASQAREYEAPLSGYGALCSQVTETQYFAQFGVDVSLPVATAYSPTPSPPSSPMSSPTRRTTLLTPPDLHTILPEEPPLKVKRYGSRLRGPLLGLPEYIDFSPEPYCWGDPLDDVKDLEFRDDMEDMGSDSFAIGDQGDTMGTAQAPWEERSESEENNVKDLEFLDDTEDMESDLFAMGTAQPPWEEHSESKEIEVDTTPAAPLLAEIGAGNTSSNTSKDQLAANGFTQLSEFETWVLSRIREAHSKGDSVVDELQKVHMRVKALEQENSELTAFVAQMSL